MNICNGRGGAQKELPSWLLEEIKKKKVGAEMEGERQQQQQNRGGGGAGKRSGI